MATDYIKSFYYSDNGGYIAINATLAEGYNWYSATIKITGGYGFSGLDENGETTFTIGGGTPGPEDSGIDNSIEFHLNKSGSDSSWGFYATLTAVANIRGDYIEEEASIDGSGGGSGGGSSGTRFEVEYGEITDISPDEFKIDISYTSDDSSNTYKGIKIEYSFNDGNTWIPADDVSDTNEGTSGTAYGMGYKIKDENDLTTVRVRATIFGSSYNRTSDSIYGEVTYYSPPIITLSANPPILTYNDTSLILSINESSGIRTEILSGSIRCALSDTPFSFDNWINLVDYFGYISGSSITGYINSTNEMIDLDLTCIDISQFDIWSTLILLNKKYICFEIPIEFVTIGGGKGYYRYQKTCRITVMTDKDCPRVKDDNGIYQPYIPHIVKMDDPSNPVWSPCNYQAIQK